MRLNWHAPRGCRTAHKPRFQRPGPVTPTRVEKPYQRPACAASAASLACVRMRYAIDRFNEACERLHLEDRIRDRIREIQCQSTRPYHIRFEEGYGQTRVYLDGSLQFVINTHNLGRSQFDNGAPWERGSF